MQFQVPQFIEIEDRIVGPLTLKQFLYLGGAAVLLLFFWFLFEFFLWLLLAIPVTVFAGALAFLKVNNRPLIHYVKGAIFYMLKPRLYLWSRESKEGAALRPARNSQAAALAGGQAQGIKERKAEAAPIADRGEPRPEGREASKVEPTRLTPTRLRELANILDTRVKVRR